MPTAEFTELALRLGAAALLGGVLGLQREMHGRPAGLRTHLLVSLGAAAFTTLSPVMARMSPGGPADAGRIAAQVVTGIGFLGAGAILKEGLTIRGLTTAASLWIAAAIGTTAGAGQWAASGLTTVIALVALTALPSWERVLPRESRYVVRVLLPRATATDEILAAVREQGLQVTRCDREVDLRHGTSELTLTVRVFGRGLAEPRCGALVAALDRAGIEPLRVIWRTL